MVVVDVVLVVVEVVVDVDVVEVVASGPSPTEVVPHAVSNASIPSATRRRTDITPRLQPATGWWWQPVGFYSAATISAMNDGMVRSNPSLTDTSASCSTIATSVSASSG